MKKISLALLSLALATTSSYVLANDTTMSSTSTKSATHESAGEYIKDSAITTKVKSELLADSDISSLHISVKTNKHVVMLTGTVETAAQKDKAGEIAGKIDGVKSVKNRLIIKAKK